MTSSRDAPAVIVMARAPGEGKTRLRSALPDSQCDRLQDAMLRDAVEVALEFQVEPVHLAYTPADAGSWAECEFGGRVRSFAQEGADLGERMLAALRHVEALGRSPLVLIGSDIPLLQPQHLRSAVAALDRADVCLGPSADGGYYLLACRTAPAALFHGVAWGTDRVLNMTRRLAAESGLRCALLETLSDVDRLEDLAALRDDLAHFEGEPAFRPPRHTIAALAKR